MSGENKQPYVRFFASDWLAGTRGMRAAEVGVYITLIALMYERCEPLPEDHRRLARQCGCDSRALKRMLEELIEDGKIIRTESGLWNKRVEREFDFRRKKSSAAKEAAQTRWEKTNKNKEGQMQTHSESNADGMPYQKPEARSQNSSRGARKRGTRLPDDWKPSGQDQSYAVSKGFGAAEIDREVEKFRNYWHAKSGRDAAKLDWGATWRNWVLTALERRPQKAGMDSDVDLMRRL